MKTDATVYCPHCGETLFNGDQTIATPCETLIVEQDSIIVHGDRRHMPPAQCALLKVLIMALGKMVKREDLHYSSYGLYSNHDPALDVIKVHIHEIRSALEGADYWIKNVWGQGYMLQHIDTERPHE